MSSIGSKIARQGSATSSTAGYAHPTSPASAAPANTVHSSIDQSSHNHFFSRLRATPQPSWLHEVWLPHSYRHERVPAGAMRMGMAVMTREMMEMHIQRAPDVRGMLDCLPVAAKSSENAGFIGWRQKLGTWPTSKQYPTPRRFE